MMGTVRADVVGSLLRPDYLLATRRAGRKGAASPEEVHAAEDRAIRDAVALQERCGIEAVTDGEFRRTNFIATMPATRSDPITVSGFALVEAEPEWIGLWKNEHGNAAPLVEGRTVKRALVVDRISPARDFVKDEFTFLSNCSRGSIPKFTFPAPSWHRAAWHPVHSTRAYSTAGAFLRDMRDYTRALVEKLIEHGCTYIQLDAPNYAQWHCDPTVRAQFEAWGRDMDKEIAEDAEIDNSVFDGITGVTRAMHLCRGNAGASWVASGGYGNISRKLFPLLTNYDRLLLEYDSPRAGDFSPLADICPHTTIVLGLVTTKSGALEAEAAIEARIGEAAALVPLDRLALSPQCGFASGEVARTMSADEQEAKLRLIGDVARRIWSAN